METFLGIDWGGTYIKAGIVDERGKLLKKKVFVSEEIRKKEVFINQVKSLVESFSNFEIKGIGIGVPGLIDVKKGFIYYLPNVSGWRNYPLKSVLEKSLCLPIYIDNDANVFALAEARLGAAKKARRSIFLTLGTGLGSAIIFNGKILEGRVSAAELGHVPISLEGKKCGCGGEGCIETYIGSRHLLERYRQLKKSKLDITEVKDIFKKAVAGEKEAFLVWKEFSLALGKFLAGMVNIFNPEVIVIGGGVAGAFKLFRPLVWQVIKQQAMWPNFKGLKLVKAKIKDAGIVGAALLAKENVNTSYSV